MQRTSVLASILLLCLAGPAVAQLFGPPTPKIGVGAGKSVADVVCADQTAQTFCGLIRNAGNDPLVRDLTDPTFVGTVFVPLDNEVKDQEREVQRRLGVASIAAARGNAAARLVASNVIVGQALQFGQLKNDDKFINALRQELEIDTGLLGGAGSLLGGLYIEGPVNTIRLRSSDGYNNIPAARAYLHRATGILVPK